MKNEEKDNIIQENTLKEVKKEKILDKSKLKNKQKNNSENIKNKDISNLDLKIKKLEKKLHETKLRKHAEIANILRRTQIDIEKAYKFSLEKFVYALLPVIDSLERALESENNKISTDSDLKKGIELTLKIFLDVIDKFEIKIIKDVNVPFNPEIHQAISTVESTEIKSNFIINIIQKGYTLNNRLLRPAMVIVSK